MSDKPFNKNLQKKLQTFFVIFLSVLFVTLIMIVVLKENDYKKDYTALIDENKLKISGFKMVYVLDGNSYVNLNAETASAERISTSVALKDLSLKYSSHDVSVEAYADSGSYELQRILKAQGNINGFINDMSFKAGDNGTLTYDYNETKGSIDNGVFLTQGNNRLSAEKALFDVNNNFIEFVNNAVLEYYPKSE